MRQDITSSRTDRAYRSKSSQCKHIWLTAEEIGKYFNMTGDSIREVLCELGYGSKVAKKPTEESFHLGIARKYHHSGKTKFKWNRKIILPVIKEHLKEKTQMHRASEVTAE